MFIKKSLLCCLFLLSCHSSANEGVWINSTRVVYNEVDLSKALTVNNASDNHPYLIRAWVVDEKNNLKSWVVTPPIYRLKEKGSVQLKITATDIKNLSKDKESLFYINVLAIPGSKSEEALQFDSSVSGQINLAVNTKLKIFYRPDLLSDVNLNDEYKKIKFTKQYTNLKIENPTPFHMNFSELKVDGVSVNNDQKMIKPFSLIDIQVKKEPSKVTYRLINDFGGETQRIDIVPEG